jgi:hypothetical protein
MEKSIELSPADADAYQWLCQAMAHWKLGHQQVARQWYDRSVEWIAKQTKEKLDKDKEIGMGEDVRSIQREAEKLLGLKFPE